jgi:hypothetical protein
MASTLMGATISTGYIEAVYQYTAFGAVKVGTKASGWPPEVTAAATALLSATQAEAGEVGTVVKVQIYSPITDPQGAPGFSAPGEQLDVTFQAGNSPQSVRVGDDEVVPATIAAARNALKTALQAEI